MSQRAALLAGAVLSLMVGIGCATRRTAAGVPPSGGGTPEAATATLELIGITPPSGGQLSKKSTVVADLAYSITGFRSGGFFVMAQVETTDPGMTTDGSAPSHGYPVLSEPTGTLKVSFPIRHVWDEPRVKRPFRIWFYLNQHTAPRQSRMIAKAGPLEYEAR